MAVIPIVFDPWSIFGVFGQNGGKHIAETQNSTTAINSVSLSQLSFHYSYLALYTYMTNADAIAEIAANLGVYLKDLRFYDEL
jgi:hypothetical protein